MSALPVLPLAFGAIMKLAKPALVVEGVARPGLPVRLELRLMGEPLAPLPVEFQKPTTNQ